MEAPAPAEVFLFEAFRFDRRAGALFRRRDEDGVLVTVPIGARALAVLDTLAARQGELVSKEEIMDAVWPGTAVAENNLSVQIAALRRVLDHGRAGSSCIQTIAGRGYRFVAPVRGVPRKARADAAAVPPNPAPPRLSIVVLPLNNLSDDREQQYFADGITEDLTTDLSRIENMLVISRNTAFTYKDRSVDTKRIGRELNVRYVLEGSVRRSGDRIRVNVQLIDAATDRHLWTERFDRESDDLFALQNEITSRLANALGAELIAVEGARPTDNPDAHDLVLRGRAAALNPTSRESYAEMIGLFEAALALDPQSVEATARLASALANRAMIGVTDTAAADILLAAELVERALAAAPRYAPAHIAKGDVLRVQGRSEQAIAEYEMVLAIDHNAVGVMDALADCKLLTGKLEEVVRLEERATGLSPRDPGIGWWRLRIGHARLLQSRSREAIPWLEQARSAVPELPLVHALLAAAYGLEGHAERAAAELAEAQRLTGDNHVSSIAALKAFGNSRGFNCAPNIDYESTYFAGLRQAGMPEE